MKWVLGMIALLVIAAGCTRAAQKDGHGEWTPEEVAAMEKEEAEKKAVMEGEWTPEEMAAMEKEHEATMSGAYQDWDKAKFDKAVSEGKIVLLDFAANWCPACQAEHPQLIAGFESLNDPLFVGFRIHYKDDQTTSEHAALAQQYQIPYQHTKVVIKDGKVVLKSPEAWTAERLVSELGALA
jgi:thiol-disulfide isomerase/thioredoxin